MKPILFSTPMVQAILNDMKDMTRRVITNVDFQPWVNAGFTDEFIKAPENGLLEKAPIKAGDVLWVRETWMLETEQRIHTGGYIYRATDRPEPDGDDKLRWRPSIFMPKEAARIFLRVTEVRAERLEEIDEQDAISEGALLYEGWQSQEYIKARDEAHASRTKPPLGYSPRQRFHHLWDKLNAARGYGWDKNPWVWVYTFERITREEAIEAST